MGPPRRSHFLLVFCGGEQLFAPAQKQGQGRRTGQSIRNGLRGVDSHDAACHPGQNNSQGNQQDHFTQQGQEQTGTGLAQSHKGSLAGQLSAKGPDTAKEDWHNPAYQMAERKLKGQVADGKLPAAAWREEKARLETEYRDLKQELTPLYADTKKLWAIHYSIYEVQHEQERQNAAVRQKKQEIEH